MNSIKNKKYRQLCRVDRFSVHAVRFTKTNLIEITEERFYNFAMSHYRRLKIKGGLYFFTVVTYQRQPIFNNETARVCLRQVWIDVRQRWPFDVIALCLLPDHLHCIWQLPEEDDNFSIRWSLIKRRFVQEYRQTGSCGLQHGVSGMSRNESGIWQRRFWEHNIKDRSDLQKHIDYIHMNPIKHGLVGKAEDWPWSTYKRYLVHPVNE